MKIKNESSKTIIAAAVMAVVLVASLAGCIVMLASGAGGSEESKVTQKEIQKAEEAQEAGTEMQTTAIKEDITVTPSGASTSEAAENNDAAKAGDGEYVLPESNTRKLTAADVSGLSKEQLRIARNEIMARHGRTFKDASLQEYFNSKSWYKGTISPADFDASMESRLSEIEKANVEFIKSYE